MKGCADKTLTSKIYIIGYPDSAHNLGIIYQGYAEDTASYRDIKKAIEYFERAKQWGYSASCNARKWNCIPETTTTKN